MEVEPLRSKDAKSMDHPASAIRRRRKCRNICFGCLGVLVLLIIVIVILAFTVFKAKDPVIAIDSVSLAGLKFSVDLARLQALLNASLDVDLSIKNPNKIGLKYSKASAQLNYRGQQVGEVPIPAGKISADKTMPMNLTLTIMADRLISDSKFFSDVSGGELPLNTFAKISGKVNMLNLFKIRVVSSTSCDVIIYLSNQTVGDQDCKYKTKLK